MGNVEKRDLKQSNLLRLIGQITLVVGLIMGIVLFIVVISGGDDDDIMSAFLSLFYWGVPSVFVWALCNVVSNISDNLTKIANTKNQ